MRTAIGAIMTVARITERLLEATHDHSTCKTRVTRRFATMSCTEWGDPTPGAHSTPTTVSGLVNSLLLLSCREKSLGFDASAPQRAALILCDVLDWSAKDAAELLEISVSAVNSALQCARARLSERLPSHNQAWPASVDASAAERDLLKKYVEAGEAAAFRALASIIREDATFRMPPEPGTARPRRDIQSMD